MKEPSHHHIMAVIENLPNETLHNVLSRLDRSDIASTALVSRRFNSLSESLLYKYLDLEYSTGAGPQLELLLHTLLLAPHRQTLAQHVRSLSFQLGHVHRSQRNELGDVARLTVAAAQHGLANWPRASPCKQLVLLLNLLPRLDRLEIIHSVGGRFFQEFTYMLQRATPLPLALANIREFTCLSSIAIRLHGRTVHALMSLPRLHTFSIAFDGCTRFNAPRGTSPITNLTLHTYMLPEPLTTLLLFPRELKHLTFRTSMTTFDLYVVQLGKAFAPLCTSLQSLDLNFAERDMAGWLVRPDLYTTIGSLRGWGALRTLRCPLMALLGVERLVNAPRLADVLPPGLWKLGIYGDECWPAEKVVEEVVEMLGRRGCIPALKEVGIGEEIELTPQMGEELRCVCEGVGVNLARGMA